MITNLQTLIQNLKAFDAYIKGGKCKSLYRPMKVYNKNIQQLKTDFNVTTINHIEIREHIESILKNFCVSQENANKYFAANLSVYNLLEELSKEGYIQANYFLELIDKKTRVGLLTLIIHGLIPAGIIASLLSASFFSGVVAFITAFLESQLGLPILSLIYTAGKATYDIYYITTDRKQNSFNSIRDVSFILLKSFISIIAYSLVLASSITITPIVASIVIAGLLVLTSVINSFRELFCLVQELVKKESPPLDSESLLYNQKSYLRHEMGYKKHRNAAIINLVSAIAFTMVTAISFLVPGGFLVTLGAVAAFALIYGIQYVALNYNERIIREELQEELSLINNEHIGSNDLEMTELHSCDSLAFAYSSKQQSENKSKPKEAKAQLKSKFSFSTSCLSFFSSSTSDDERDSLNDTPTNSYP